MISPGDPSLNPWLQVRRHFKLEGYDQYGLLQSEVLTSEFRPSYYFWLGADAYPEFEIVQAVVGRGHKDQFFPL